MPEAGGTGVLAAADAGFAGRQWMPTAPRSLTRRASWVAAAPDGQGQRVSVSLAGIGRACRGWCDIWRGECADTGGCQGVLSRMVLRLSSCATSFRICRVIIGVM